MRFTRIATASAALIALLFLSACSLVVPQSPDSTTTPTSDVAQQVKESNPSVSQTGEETLTLPTSQLPLVTGKDRPTGIGFINIPGMITNTTDKWLRATVAIKLLDANGKPLTTNYYGSDKEQEQTVSPTGPIPPGGKGYFLYVRDEKKVQGKFSSHQASVKSTSIPSSYQTSELSGLTYGEEKFALTVKGTYKNTSAQVCKSPTVTVALFDKSSGELLYVSDFSAIDLKATKQEIAAGESLEFSKIISKEVIKYLPSTDLASFKFDAVSGCGY
ncbi:MAG: hypothetical protein WCP97_06260 [bacterium]